MIEREKFHEVKKMLAEIYAVHGKSVPSEKIAEVIIRQMLDKPLAFMSWAAARMGDYDRLPGNMGLELRQLYSEWTSRRGIGSRKREACPDCDKSFPGFFFYWKRNEQGVLYERLARCQCNDDPNERGPKKSKTQVAKEGFTVIPRGYDGGDARFVKRIMQVEPQGPGRLLSSF